jgi:hypothetical protein
MMLSDDVKRQDVILTITQGILDTEPGLRGVHFCLTTAPSKASSVNGIRTLSGRVPLLTRNKVTTMVKAEFDVLSVTTTPSKKNTGVYRNMHVF